MEKTSKAIRANDKEATIEKPRDRKGNFELQLLHKNSKELSATEDIYDIAKSSSEYKLSLYIYKCTSS